MPDLNDETAYRQDPETGLLESPRTDRISVETKQTIAEMFRKSGNLTLACRSIGVDPRVMRQVANSDPAFRALLDEAREEISDRAEGFVVQWMGEQRNVIDRLAWLRAHRSERWNPKQEMTVTHNVGQTKALAVEARKVIETTATPQERTSTP